MLISDIGQSNIEEINLGAVGANYGWNDYEGTFQLTSTSVVDDLPSSHVSDEFTYPVAQYDHDFDNNGIAIISSPSLADRFTEVMLYRNCEASISSATFRN